MFGYIVRRLVAAFLVVVLTSMITFAVFFFGPSNPADLICQQGGHCTAEKQQRIEHELGLDQSVVSQYGKFVKGLFVDREIEAGGTYHCDAPCLGISYSTKLEVRKEMTKRYPVTIWIAVGGSIIFLSVGVTLGVLAARWRGTVTDKSLVTGSLLLYAVPYYVVCLVAWIYLVNEWGIFKDGNDYAALTEDPAKWFAALLLPWLVLGVCQSDAVCPVHAAARWPRCSGRTTCAPPRPRACPPTRSSSGTRCALRSSRSSRSSAWTSPRCCRAPSSRSTSSRSTAIGKWAIDSLSPIDFPIIFATVLVYAVLVVISNLIVDIVYSFIDPRVRLA